MTTIYPTNEAELIELFRLAQDQLGWCIVDYTTRLYPDAIIENSDGQQLTVEFEHCAKNFHAHGHDPAGCDLIICWANNWPDAPLPVWALQECRAVTDFLPFVTRLADFMGRRMAREIQAEVSNFGGTIARIDASLAQAYYKTEAHQEQDRKRDQELEDLRRKVHGLEFDIKHGPKEPAGWHRFGRTRVYSMSREEFDRFGVYLESLYNQVPEARLFWLWWDFQHELRDLSMESDAYLGVDMNHPAWTGKTSRGWVYPDWALDYFYNRRWLEIPTKRQHVKRFDPDPMPWLWEHF